MTIIDHQLHIEQGKIQNPNPTEIQDLFGKK